MPDGEEPPSGLRRAGQACWASPACGRVSGWVREERPVPRGLEGLRRPPGGQAQARAGSGQRAGPGLRYVTMSHASKAGVFPRELELVQEGLQAWACPLSHGSQSSGSKEWDWGVRTCGHLAVKGKRQAGQVLVAEVGGSRASAGLLPWSSRAPPSSGPRLASLSCVTVLLGPSAGTPPPPPLRPPGRPDPCLLLQGAVRWG